MSEYEALSFLRQVKDECPEGFDCYFWIEGASAQLNGEEIEWSKLKGIPVAELQHLLDFVESEERRCGSGGDAEKNCGAPAIVSIPARALAAVCNALEFESVGADTCGILEWLAPLVKGMLDYIVHRLQYIVSIALEVGVFFLGFGVFSVGVQVIWGAQRLLTAAMYGDWEQVKDLSSKPMGLAAFAPLKSTPLGRMAKLVRKR